MEEDGRFKTYQKQQGTVDVGRYEFALDEIHSYLDHSTLDAYEQDDLLRWLQNRRVE